MMRYLFGFGIAAAFTWVAPFTEAPLRAEESGSFLNRTARFAARLNDDQPVPEVDPATVPSTSESVLPDGDTYHDYSSNSAPIGAGYAPTFASSDACNGCGDGNCAGGCADGGCSVGIASSLGCCGCSPWYGGAYGLVMTRSDDFDTYLSYDGAFPVAASPLFTTGDASIEHGGGVEANIGRYLNDCWAIQGNYWGFFPEEQYATVFDADLVGGLYSAIGYDGLSYNDGTGPADVLTFYGDVTGVPSQAHRIQRSFEAHNFELNMIRNPYRRNSGCVHFELLAGFRYLRLDDGLIFSTAFADPMFGNAPNSELHHVIDAENHLAGFQLGGRADRRFHGRWGAHLGTKFGIYNNHIKHRQRLYGGNGNAYVTATNVDYAFRSEDDDIAFVGELFTGVSYDVNACWRLTGGYRAIAACGVAQSTSQFPRNREFANIVRTGQIDSEDCLVLHGAYFGLEYNW